MDFPLYPVSKFAVCKPCFGGHGAMGSKSAPAFLLVGRVSIFCVAIYEEAVVVAATRTRQRRRVQPYGIGGAGAIRDGHGANSSTCSHPVLFEQKMGAVTSLLGTELNMRSHRVKSH
jgi:hypothetical protein